MQIVLNDDVFNEKVKVFIAEADKPAEQVCVELINLGANVKSFVNTDVEITTVKKEVEKMLQTVESLINLFTEKVQTKVQSVLDETLSLSGSHSYLKSFGDLLGKEIDAVKSDVKQITGEAKNAVSLITDNAEKVSNTKTEGIINQINSLQEVIRNVEQEIKNQLDSSRTTSFSYALQEHLETLFGKDAVVIKVFKNILEEFNANFSRQIEEVKTLVAKESGKADMFDKTAIKGTNFEDEVFDILSELASNTGDLVINTSLEGALNKRGDIIYELDNSARIVIECKDTPIGLKSGLDYLDTAIENRMASFGILVVKKPEQLQKQIALLNFYQGNKIFCTVDLLPYVVRMVKVYLMMNQKNSDIQIDTTAISQNLEELNMKIKNFKSIKSHITKLKNFNNKEMSELTDLVISVETDMQATIQKIENLLNI